MKKQEKYSVNRSHNCALCDSKNSSVTFYGKAVCDECLRYIKSNFEEL